MTATLISKDVKLARTFAAPRDLVFKAWTDAKMVAAWWGPHGFTNPVCRVDARKGGAIYIDMKAPDGQVFPMKAVIDEIDPPSRLVFTSSALGPDGKPLFESLTAVTFEEKNGQTTVKVTASVKDAPPEAAPYLAGMDEGWSQTMDRMVAFVTKK